LNTNFTLIENPESLLVAVTQLANAKEIGVDLEFDDNRHSYGRHLCLIQIADERDIFLIDTIAISNISSVIRLLEDSRISKIFHSCKNDLLILSELYDAKLQNIHDTSLMYKLINQLPNEIGLGRLIEEKIGVVLNKNKQDSNWLHRPLSATQLSYAAADVKYLFQLKQILAHELETLGRTEWYEQERANLEKVRFYAQEMFSDQAVIKYKMLPHQVALYKVYWQAADQIAKAKNKPHYQIISKDKINELVTKQPLSLAEWKNVSGCHPNFKRLCVNGTLYRLSENILKNKEQIDTAYYQAASVAKTLEAYSRMYLATQINERKNIIKKISDYADDFEGISIKNLFFTESVKNEIINQGTAALLRNWQIGLLKQICDRIGIDEMILRHPLSASFNL
jgi:ribonuclease D